MREFMVLMGQLFLIVCIQSIMEAFAGGKKNSFTQRILSIACYLGSFYIILQFTFDHLLRDISRLLQSLF